MPRFMRAVLIGAAMVLCIEVLQLLIVRVVGWSPMWTLLANAAAYGFTGLLAAAPPHLRQSALAGGIVGLLDGMATLGVLYLAGVLRNQTPWLVLVPLVLGVAALAGGAIGTLGGVVARKRAREPAQAGA